MNLDRFTDGPGLNPPPPPTDFDGPDTEPDTSDAVPSNPFGNKPGGVNIEYLPTLELFYAWETRSKMTGLALDADGKAAINGNGVSFWESRVNVRHVLSVGKTPKLARLGASAKARRTLP